MQRTKVLRLAAPIAAVWLLVAAANPRPPVLIDGGGFTLDHQPDSNSVIFEDDNGLVVIDTGRHPQHQAKILAFARTSGKPVKTIVNTHWHLDHSGGNAEIRAVFPDAKLYASMAVAGALRGFLAKSRASSEKQLADPSIPEAIKQEIRIDLDAIKDTANLIPDMPVNRDFGLRLSDRNLDVHLASRAATEGDLWLYDPISRTLVAGDLVTLPAPFFDTACPQGWRRVLATLGAVPFKSLIPGHGKPMTHADFDIYRTAFENLIDCSNGNEPKQACIERWQKDAAPLLAGEADRKAAAVLLNYYFDSILRSAVRKAEYCGTGLGNL